MFGTGPVRLQVAWRKPLEGGWSGLAVAGDRLYTLYGDDESDYAVALDAATGKEVWKVRLDAKHAAAENGPGSTPSVDGGRVYVISPSCRLQALDAANGSVVWQRHLREELGSASRRGCMTSPLVEGDLLIVQVSGETDNRLVAFDKKTGTVSWSSQGAGRTPGSSPVVADLAGVRQVVVNYMVSAQGAPVVGLYGARVTDGTVLWTQPFEKDASFDTPVVLPGDRVLLPTWGNARLFAVKPKDGKLAAEPLWVSADQTSVASPPVFHDGHLYGFGGESLVCLNAATGAPVWKEKIYSGSVILVDGHLVVLSQTAGLVRVVEATPAGYREKARLEVLTPGAPADTPPSFAGRRILVRNAEEIVAVEVQQAR